MNLYAESSAVLAWLLGQPGASEVREALQSAELVVASDLTLVECDRVLIRAYTLEELSEAEAAEVRSRFVRTAQSWSLLRIAVDVVERARRLFPGEPIRTLDALHLASALVVSAAVPDFGLLSLDQKVRAAGRQLGLAVVPRKPPVH